MLAGNDSSTEAVRSRNNVNGSDTSGEEVMTSSSSLPDTDHDVATAGAGDTDTATASSITLQTEPCQPSGCAYYQKDHNNRTFQEKWYHRWTWLDWNQQAGNVLCHPCKMACQLGLLHFAKNAEPTFSKTGFSNWKDAGRCFQRHEASASHAESLSKWRSYCAGLNVAAQISSQHKEHQKTSQSMLLKILSSLRYLSRQGLAIRGHSADEGNFQLLVRLRCEDDADFSKWMKQKASYMSHAIQNEYLQLMAHHVLRGLLSEIRKTQYYSIICDEVTDQARQHQIGVSIRWVDENFAIHEDFIELGLLPAGDAETITKMIQDCLCRVSLPLELCRGQCYDGASVMSGAVAGVSSRIAACEPRAVYVHCLAHSLNLALQESARNLPVYRDMMEYTKDIVNLIRMSPKRSALLCSMQGDDDNATGSRKGHNLRPLCPTRWTTRHESINSILDNFTAVRDTLAEIAEREPSDAGTRASGLFTRMTTFTLYFSMVTGLLIFSRTEALSKTLQAKSMTVAAAMLAARNAHDSIQRLREDGSWTSLWASCVDGAILLDVDPPCVPRVRRPSRRIDTGAPPTVQSAEEYHKMIFFQLVDNILEAINSRLHQKNIQFYVDAEELILSSACKPVESLDERATFTRRIGAVCDHFGSDLDVRSLTLQLEMLYDLMDGKSASSLSDITAALTTLGPAKRLYSQLSKLITLLLVIPATSATAERSFSCVRRLKTYLRSTISQARLNHLLVLHTHQDLVDNLDLKAVARDFVAVSDYRRNIFGSF